MIPSTFLLSSVVSFLDRLERLNLAANRLSDDTLTPYIGRLTRLTMLNLDTNRCAPSPSLFLAAVVEKCVDGMCLTSTVVSVRHVDSYHPPIITACIPGSTVCRRASRP